MFPRKARDASADISYVSYVFVSMTKDLQPPNKMNLRA